MTPLRAVLAGGLVALLCVLAVILSGHRLQIASTDRVPNGQFASIIDHDQRLCQQGEIVPAETAALRMTIGDYNKPSPPLRIGITEPASSPGAHSLKISSGLIAAGWRQGVVVLPISPVRHEVASRTWARIRSPSAASRTPAATTASTTSRTEPRTRSRCGSTSCSRDAPPGLRCSQRSPTE